MTEINVSQELRDVENALRDFITTTMRTKFGTGWETQCGLSEERLAQWTERRATEAKRQLGGIVEQRLIYYADFYDLKTILKKNWSTGIFNDLGDWRTIEVWLTELEALRDPDAHRRDLLPHQQKRIAGISGELRSRIVRSRNIAGGLDQYFPKIESIRDNYGNVWHYNDSPQLETRTVLHPGDVVEFVVTATDPDDEPLQYLLGLFGSRNSQEWQQSNILTWRVTKADINRYARFMISIISGREYHANGDHDDLVLFMYTILP
jgi:hypothetical protein